MSDAKIVIGATDQTAGAFASAKAKLDALGLSGAALGEKLGRIGAALGVAFSVGGLKHLIDSTAEGIDKLNDLSDATGSTVENLSALEDTAARTGTSLETVGSALVKLNKTIADAKPGTDAEAALKAIGTSAKELRDLDPAEALLRTAQGLAQFNDDGNKARLAQELFGKSLREVAPLLKDLAEKGALNAKVTTEQAAIAERYRQNADALKKDLLDLSRTAIIPLIEAYLKVREAAAGADVEFEKLSESAQLIAVPLQALAVLGANVAFVLKGIGREIGAIAAQSVALASLDFKAFSAIGKAVKEDGENARKELDDFERRVLGLGKVSAKSERDRLRALEAGSATRGSAPVVGDAAAAAEIQKRFDAYLARLDDGIRATAQLTDSEKLEIAVAEKSAELRGFSARQLDILIGKTRALDEVTGKAAEARLRRDKQNQQGGQTDESGNILVNVNALAAQSKAAQIDRLAQAMASVRDQMSGAAGKDLVRFQQALQVLDEQMKSLQDSTQGLSEKLNQFNEDAKEVGLEIQDALGSSLAAAMEGNARKIDRIFGDMIRRLVLKAASAKLMENLFGNLAKTGELGGLFGRFAGAIGIGASSSSGGGAFTQVGGDKFVNAGSGKTSASGLSKGGVTIINNVQGDLSTKAQRIFQANAAQLQATQQRRTAMGAA